MASFSARQTGGSLSASVPSANHFFRPAEKLASRVATRWHRWRTQRMIEGLPLDIRKDIGWPTSDTDDVHHQDQ